MELTVLVDNNTYIDKYFHGEPGLSFYIEDENKKILFDLGYSKIFSTNAEKMNINLKDIDTLVFSHGHNDHTRGLLHFDRQFYMSKCKIVAHPLTFCKKEFEGKYIGCPITLNELFLKYRPSLSKTPTKISDNITFLGEIPQYNNFEQRQAIGEVYITDKKEPDYIIEDSAIVYKNNNGIFIITGCSHSGICNIIEHAKRVCQCNNIIGVVGGFHLFENNERVQKTIEYFKQNNIRNLYPCHCISFEVKAEIHKHIPIQEVGVGLKLRV